MEDPRKYEAIDLSRKADAAKVADTPAPADTSYTGTTDEEVAALLIGLSDEDGMGRSVHHSSKKRKNKRKRRWWLILLIVLGVLLVLGAVLIQCVWWWLHHTMVSVIAHTAYFILLPELSPQQLSICQLL